MPDVRRAATGREQIEDVEIEDGLDEGREEEFYEDEEATDQRAEVEAEARKQGWKPKEEWDGHPSAWTDADEYVRRGDPRYLRKLVDQQDKSLKQMQRQREQEARAFDERIARLDKMNGLALKRQREQLTAQIEHAKRTAAIDGDIEAYDAYAQQQQQVAEAMEKEEREIAPPPQQRQQQAPQPNPDLDAWVKANLAVRYHKEKWPAAVAFYEETRDPTHELYDASEADKTAFVTERLNEAFGANTARMPGQRTQRKMTGQQQPQQQQQRQPARTPQTEGGSRMATQSQPRGKGWNDIPAEERKILDRHIAEGLYDDEPGKHDAAKARAAATKAYWS